MSEYGQPSKLKSRQQRVSIQELSRAPSQRSWETKMDWDDGSGPTRGGSTRSRRRRFSCSTVEEWERDRYRDEDEGGERTPMLPPAPQPRYGIGMGGPTARRDVSDYPNGRSHDAAATEDKVVRQGSLVIHGIRTVMLVEAVATDRQSLKSPTRLDRGTKSTGMVFQSPITNWQTLYRPGGGGGGGLAWSKTVRSAKPLDSNGGIGSMPNDSVDSGDTCGGALAAAASSFLVVESMRGVGIRLAIVIWID